MSDAVICRRCTSMIVYWESPNETMVRAFRHGVNPFFVSDGMPSCNSCGGDTKIAMGIDAYYWCDDCGMHKKRCTCRKGEWGQM